jgi:predicted pyridoxine 5'-phosphate oxidase superfamily flavin-nucleotide-binding protein
MRLESPFHEGELLVQQRVGEVSEAQQNGRILADTIPKGASKFIEQQPMVILGSVDAQHNVWASVLFGHPGFIKSVNPQTIELDLTQAILHAHDPLWTNINHDNRIGILIIELVSRRRLRINGTIAQTTSERLRLHVLESYPNCPKYIQRRRLALNLREVPNQLSEPRFGQALSEQQGWIESADTLFVATAHPTGGVDASHRGGNPGFIRMLDHRTLRIPDYIGNSMFNTLGNLVVNPQAGLVFLDCDRSRTLQLVGRTTIQWNLDDPAHPTGGTHRYWDFKVERWLETDLLQPLQWEFLDYSPYNPAEAES